MFCSFISFLIAIWLISLFKTTPLANLVDADLSVMAHPFIVGMTGLIALLTGLLAGVYAARFVTSFAPALVLNGSFGLSQKGKSLRNTLIGFQFADSFVLIISSSFLFLQNKYMKHGPLGYYVVNNRQSGIAHIKLKEGADVHDAMSYIRATLAEFNTEFPFTIRFYDEVLQNTYKKESLLSSLIALFCLIAIFISIVGVFGLVVFDSECRRKEIGIRKVFGASTMVIIAMFNKAYFRILAICFVVAAPVAWFAVNSWLQNFAYKTPMYWWVFLLAFVAVGVITACTVTFQNWRVANDNPVNNV